jgi:hypothetical protein
LKDEIKSKLVEKNKENNEDALAGKEMKRNAKRIKPVER